MHAYPSHQDHLIDDIRPFVTDGHLDQFTSMSSLAGTPRALSDMELLKDDRRKLAQSLRNRFDEENDGWRLSFPILQHFIMGPSLR